MQTDRPIGDVLFSGQLALPQYTAIGSAGVLLAILLFKGVAYAFALAARIEGGPIFPAIALGAAAGLAASLLLPGAAVVPMVAVAVAASAAAVDRLPVFGIVFSVLVLGSDNALVATLFSIIGALVGSALGTILEQRRARVVTPAA
jgi:H+/Cl- antiporter ClcA